MTEISIKQILQIDAYWLRYKKDDGSEGHIQLSACANNFAIHRGGEERCLGLRYEKDGFGCYELFNVGHTLIKCPLHPGGLQKLLGGKNAGAKLREQFEAIEAQFNRFGWKTKEETI